MRYFIVKMVLLCLLCFGLFPVIVEAMPSTSANNAVLIEQETGRVLYEKNANDEALIASITKIMTAIIALESGELTDNVPISERAMQTEGSSIYLVHDSDMSLEDLLYGLLLRSGNDAAVAIAEHIGGSVEGFGYLMNEKARYLGMTNTHFANPSGLDDEEHYSTAYDMAILMRYAMENAVFQSISQAKSYVSDQRDYKWYNKNKLLTKLYTYCTGGKTGFTKAAGRTLVTTATKEGIDLIAVTLDGPDDWNDHISMYEWGFTEVEKMQLEEKGSYYFLNEADELIHGLLLEDVVYPLTVTEQEHVRKVLTFPVQQQKDTIAQLEYWLDEEVIATIPVYRDNRNDRDTFLQQCVQVFEKVLQVQLDG